MSHRSASAAASTGSSPDGSASILFARPRRGTGSGTAQIVPMLKSPAPGSDSAWFAVSPASRMYASSSSVPVGASGEGLEKVAPSTSRAGRPWRHSGGSSFVATRCRSSATQSEMESSGETYRRGRS